MGCLNGEETQILIAHQKDGIDWTKKVWLGFRGFRTCFWEVDHPLWDVFKAKNSNSYCSSEGRNRLDKKSTASRFLLEYGSR